MCVYAHPFRLKPLEDGGKMMTVDSSLCVCMHICTPKYNLHARSIVRSIVLFNRFCSA